MTVKRVLVVDDSPTQALRTKLVLETLGFSVVEANNGKMALEIALQDKPDVIVSDILMPEMDGFELCHLIRTNAELQRIPVILQTASYRAKEDREFGLDIGADAFIPKGSSAEEMAKLINRIVTQSRKNKRGSQDGSILKKPFDALHAQRILFRLLEETAKLEQANIAIKIERNRAQKYLDVASVMMIAFDREGKVTMINPRGCQILGVESEDVIDQNWFETFVTAKKRDEVRKAHNQILSNKGNNAEYIEYAVITKSGEERLIAWRNTVLTDDAGEISGVLSSGEDITERKQAEEQIRYSEAELRKAQAYAHIGSWIWDIKANKSTWSEEMHHILGIPVEIFCGSPEKLLASKIIHPDDIQKIQEMRRSVTEDKKPVSFEFRVLLPNHPIRYVWMESGELILDDQGMPSVLKGTLQDITERKIAEMKVKESEEKYRSLFENVPDGVYRIALDGSFLAANPGLVHMLGYKSEEEMQKTCFLDLFFDAQDREPFAQSLKNGDNIQNMEVRFRHKKGELIIVLNNAIAIRDSDDNILYYEGTLTNITKLKQAEAELANLYRIEQQRVERLSALQKISSQLAGIHSQHEVMEIVAAQTGALMDSLVCATLKVDGETGEVFIVARSGSLESPAAVDKGVPLTLPILDKAIKNGQPLFLKEIDQEAPELRGLNLHPDIRSIHMYPISWEGQILGFIVLGSPLAQPPSEGEMATMELLAERAAAALESARLFEEINSNLQRLASLRSIDQAITSSMDINFTLGILLDQAVSQLKVHAADILLLDQGATSFRYGVGRGFNTTVPPNATLGIANSFAGRAVLERRTLHVSDLAKESSEFQRPSQFLKEGFVSLFCTPLIAKGQVKGVLEVLHHESLKPTADWLAFLETLAGQAAIAIDNAELFTNLQRSNADLSLAYDATIQGWSDALDLRDKETEGHTQRVTEMTLKLAAMMGISEKEMVHLRRGALLHDIGKMGIPDSILLKPGPLTDEEWVIMRKHPVFAYDLISPIIYLRPALDIPFCHHEKWDGTGYPRGLQGELIPLAARIFAVVDVWDALTSDRPYRNAWSKEKTLAHIQEQEGSHFDPKVVDAFMKLILSGNSF